MNEEQLGHISVPGPDDLVENFCLVKWSLVCAGQPGSIQIHMSHKGLSENSVPRKTQWLMIIIPIKWL